MGPIRTSENGYANFFVLAKIFGSNIQNSLVHVFSAEKEGREREYCRIIGELREIIKIKSKTNPLQQPYEIMVTVE